MRITESVTWSLRYPFGGKIWGKIQMISYTHFMSPPHMQNYIYFNTQSNYSGTTCLNGQGVQTPLGDFFTPVNLGTFRCMRSWFWLLKLDFKNKSFELKKKSLLYTQQVFGLCCFCHYLSDPLSSCWGSLKEKDLLLLCYTGLRVRYKVYQGE